MTNDEIFSAIANHVEPLKAAFDAMIQASAKMHDDLIRLEQDKQNLEAEVTSRRIDANTLREQYSSLATKNDFEEVRRDNLAREVASLEAKKAELNK
jgi:hypothetical protein